MTTRGGHQGGVKSEKFLKLKKMYVQFAVKYSKIDFKQIFLVALYDVRATHLYLFRGVKSIKMPLLLIGKR